jgi:hypothetical protein
MIPSNNIVLSAESTSNLIAKVSISVLSTDLIPMSPYFDFTAVSSRVETAEDVKSITPENLCHAPEEAKPPPPPPIALARPDWGFSLSDPYILNSLGAGGDGAVSEYA